jgi:hypothetical protein
MFETWGDVMNERAKDRRSNKAAAPKKKQPSTTTKANSRTIETKDHQKPNGSRTVAGDTDGQSSLPGSNPKSRTIGTKRQQKLNGHLTVAGSLSGSQTAGTTTRHRDTTDAINDEDDSMIPRDQKAALANQEVRIFTSNAAFRKNVLTGRFPH